MHSQAYPNDMEEEATPDIILMRECSSSTMFIDLIRRTEKYSNVTIMDPVIINFRSLGDILNLVPSLSHQH